MTDENASTLAPLLVLLALLSAAPALAGAAPEPEPAKKKAPVVNAPQEIRDDLEAEGGADKQEGLRFFDTGPLRIREQFLPGMGFLALEPTSADVLNRGQWQIDLVASGTNTWVHSNAVGEVLRARDERRPLTVEQLRNIARRDGADGIYFADGELYRTSAAVRVGVGGGFQLAVTVPLIRFDGGFGDSGIQEFHDVFGTGQNGRLGVPRDAYTVYLRDEDGNETFRTEEPDGDAGDVVVGLKGRLLSTDRGRIAVEGSVKLATGDEETLYSSGNEDVGAQLLFTRYFDRSALHLSGGAVYLQESEVFHTGDQTRLTGTLGFERALGRTVSFVAQATVADSPFADLEIEGLGDPAFLLDLGLKKGFTEHLVGFVAISENFVNFDSSADFGLHVGLTQTY